MGRKPYRPEIKADWWKTLPCYRLYMLREATAVPAVWISLLLLYGLHALHKGGDAWAGFVDFLAHPGILLVNLAALMAALLHSLTWFSLAPKAVRLSESAARLVPPGLLALSAVLTIVLLVLAL